MFQENNIKTCILSRVKQITNPGWMHETSARTWCTGKTQRERVDREVGGGIGMWNTCKPMAVSFQCMTKSTTKKKKKNKIQSIKHKYALRRESWGNTININLNIKENHLKSKNKKNKKIKFLDSCFIHFPFRFSSVTQFMSII